MIRQRRNRDKTLNVIRNFDAFPKVKEEYIENTRIGGTLSLISRLLIAYLVYTETKYWLDSRLVFKFKPDTDMNTKLKVHIDLTVATPCRSIGADILDSTNQNVFSFGILNEEDTWWELSSNQKVYFDYVQHLNSYLREEYHAVAEILYKGEQQMPYTVPDRTERPTKPFDACRIHGILTLNKVAGNFHITGGKSLHLNGGHIHLAALFDDTTHNFSHRITRFSFGDHTAGIVHPLEGDEKILNDPTMLMQYYIEVVPTDIETFISHVKTFQYSVKEHARAINHHKGSHGTPGIFFKYDMSALKIHVTIDRENLVQFLVRLCSVIAGIVVLSGFLSHLLRCLMDKLVGSVAPEAIQRVKVFQQQQQQPLLSHAVPIATSTAIPNSLVNSPSILQNNLLINANHIMSQDLAFQKAQFNVPVSLQDEDKH